MSTAFVVAVVITVSIVLVVRQKMVKAEKNFEMEVISREEKVRDASREGTLTYTNLYVRVDIQNRMCIVNITISII